MLLNMHEILVNINVVGCKRVLLLDIQFVCERVCGDIRNCFVDIIETYIPSSGPMTVPWKIMVCTLLKNPTDECGDPLAYEQRNEILRTQTGSERPLRCTKRI